MAKKKKKGSASKEAAGKTGSVNDSVRGDGMYVDPARIRFQHSRIRPVFSGCGRSVPGTLQEIRDGKTQVSDLPPIQVLVGPEPSDDDDNCQQWYFSLNNRRLWVLKRLREEGLLEASGNKVFVRVRAPKSNQERGRYSVKNCALEAKIVPENANKGKGKNKSKKTNDEKDKCSRNDKNTDLQEVQAITAAVKESLTLSEDSSDEDESDDDSDAGPSSNPFGALLA